MNSRVWTYIISKELNTQELTDLAKDGNSFVKTWTAHEQQLTAGFEVFKNRIIVVHVDEDVHSASGCSIDKLTRFIKETEKKYAIELMNRLLVALKKDNGVEIVHSSKIKEMLAAGSINEDTLVYNTSVSNNDEYKNWEMPLKNTWLNKYLTTV